MNTRTTDFQQYAEVGSYSITNDMVVAWSDGLRNSSSTNDGNDYGVYFQRFSINTSNFNNSESQPMQPVTEKQVVQQQQLYLMERRLILMFGPTEQQVPISQEYWQVHIR